jgi:hypothetical protein
MSAFAAGAILGGSSTATVAWILSGLVGWLPPRIRLILLASIALSLVLRQAGVARVPLPQNARQVPQAVYLRHPVVANAQFGFEMGTGMRTLVSAVAPYLLISFLILFPPTSFFIAVAIGVSFGLTRGLVPVLWSLNSLDPAATSRSHWDVQFSQSRRLIGWVTLLICCAGASFILFSTQL